MIKSPALFKAKKKKKLGKRYKTEAPARIIGRVIFLKRIVSIVLIFGLLFAWCPVCFGESGAFLVMDGRTGAVLEEENGDQILPMASTTKIMTALVVLESVSLTDRVAISSQAAGVEGSSLYIKAGEIYSVEDLLYALMLRSANDCAVALALHAGGTVDGFVEKMNQKAKELGLNQTSFKNPNGLPQEGHHTTARELAIIMKAAMENETFRTITATKKKTIGDQAVINHNKLLTLYSGCIGGKTGYTMEAGRCLVSVAEREGAPLICVTLGRRDDWNIHTNAYEKWFSQLQSVTLAEKGAFKADLPVASGGTIVVSNSQKVEAKVFSYDQSAETMILADHLIYANKQAGQVAGIVEFWYQGTKIAQSPLVFEENLEIPLKKELFITRIFRFFRQIFLKKH